MWCMSEYKALTKRRLTLIAKGLAYHTDTKVFFSSTNIVGKVGQGLKDSCGQFTFPGLLSLLWPYFSSNPYQNKAAKWGLGEDQ